MQVPPEVTILWTDDNFGNARRLPLGAEINRQSGSGLYYHFDYVGSPRDYKWINTISLPKTWQQLTAAYERDARQIWILNAGHMKGYEEPMQLYFDMAYDMSLFVEPTSITSWLQMWATREFGAAAANGTAQVMMQYSLLAGRRKFELVDQNVYSPSNYNELDNVVKEWQTLVNNATSIYANLSSATQASFYEMVLWPATAAMNLHQVYRDVALNNVYAVERRTSTNTWAQKALNDFSQAHTLTMQWNQLLNGKWNHMVSITKRDASRISRDGRNELTSVRRKIKQSLATTTGNSQCVIPCLLSTMFRPQKHH